MIPPHPSLLAEAVSFPDGRTLVLLLVLFFAFVVVTVGLAVLGCVWAYQAGQGSSRALKAWIVVASIFGLALTSLPRPA